MTRTMEREGWIENGEGRFARYSTWRGMSGDCIVGRSGDKYGERWGCEKHLVGRDGEKLGVGRGVENYGGKWGRGNR